MYNDINCPYCEAHQDINHDDGYGYDQDEIHQQECSECEKTFTFTTSIIYHYDVEQADCLNGGEHDYKPIRGCPEEYFKDKYRCTMCGEETTLTAPKA